MATENDAARASNTSRTSISGGTSNGKLVEYDQFIEDQLHKTRSQVRAVDIAGSLMTLAAGTLVFFLAAALVDHWVISGGLGFWGRLALFVVFFAAMIAYLATQVLPLLVHRISPLYAAQTIERSRPTLKNALLNFLFLRANPGGLPGVVYHAVEEQAATNLAKVRVESAVDRTKLVHTGYVLLGILVIAAVYMLVSPKNLLLSAGRIVMPWADLGAPTRTAIVDVTPGDVQAFRGQQLTVSARIQGLPADGKAVLLYTTADGQVVERPIEMTLGADGYKHACVLPPGDAALQQSLEYRIEAGDAETKRYQVQVVAAPTIVVRSVAYHYPKYTGLLDQRVEHQGDIRAIEGTEVTLEALANQDIQSAHIDFNCDAKQDQPMRFEGQGAKVTFPLTLKDDRQSPQYASYQLVFKNAAGQQNPQPVRHQIEVTRDLPPEVQLVAPKKDDLELPLDAATQIEVVAIDPDFALAIVKLSATAGSQPLVDQMLLGEVRSGQFVRKFRFEPRKLGLKVGDVVEYWAVAEDNKQPRPNRTETAKRRMRIVSPDSKRSTQDQLARNDRRDDVERQPTDPGKRGGDDDHPRAGDTPPERKPERDEQPKEGPREDAAPQNDRQRGEEQEQGDQQPSGEQQEDKQQGQPAGKPQAGKGGESGQQQGREENVPSDGSNDGDAIERILKHQEQRQKSNPKSPDQQRGKQGAQQSSDQQNQEGQQQQRGQQDPGDGGQAQPPSAGQRERQGDQKNDRRQGSPDDRQQEQDRDRRQQSEPTDRTQDADQQQGEQGQQGDQKGKSKSEPKAKSPSDRGKSDRTGDQQGQKRQQGEKGSDAGEQNAGDDASREQQGKQGQKGQRDQKSKGSPGAKDQSGQSEGGDNTDPSRTERSSQPNGGKSSETKTPEGADAQDATDAGRDGKESDKGQDGKSRPDQKQPSSDDATKADQQSKDKSDQGTTNQDKRRTDERDSGAKDSHAGDRQPTTGEGAQSKSDPTKQRQQSPSGDQQKPDAKGGDGERDKGNSGAGQGTKDTQGSPSPTTEAKPTQKPPRTSKDDPDGKPEDQAHSAADDRRESDSEGQDSGDRSGGGKRGGGQTANKPGAGGPGQNTAADEGAGKSDESGDGETADRAGDRRAANDQKGKPGSQQGEGSQSRPSGGEGDKPGGSDAPKDAASPTEGTQPTAGQSGEGRSQSSGQPQGGKPGGAPADQKFQPTQDQADEANLEYARKATDLALAHLKDELKKGRPDPELLDRLGWTPKDLENFVKRWEQMRGQTRQPGEKGATAKKELDDALKSLGLRPKSTSLKHSAARDDQSRGLKESRRTTPPAEYAEQSKAYSQGTARGEK